MVTLSEVRDIGVGVKQKSYMIMDLAGLENGDRLKKHPLTATQLKNVVVETAKAVASFHAAGVYHGDLKPANIVHSGNEYETTHLIDYGFSKDANIQTGSGTPKFMPLEPRPFIERYDAYALGVILDQYIDAAEPGVTVSQEVIEGIEGLQHTNEFYRWSPQEFINHLSRVNFFAS